MSVLYIFISPSIILLYRLVKQRPIVLVDDKVFPILLLYILIWVVLFWKGCHKGLFVWDYWEPYWKFYLKGFSEGIVWRGSVKGSCEGVYRMGSVKGFIEWVQWRGSAKGFSEGFSEGIVIIENLIESSLWNVCHKGLFVLWFIENLTKGFITGVMLIEYVYRIGLVNEVIAGVQWRGSSQGFSEGFYLNVLII